MWREAGRNKSRKASWIQTVQGLGRQAARPGLAQVNPAEYGGQQTLGGEWIRAQPGEEDSKGNKQQRESEQRRADIPAF